MVFVFIRLSFQAISKTYYLKNNVSRDTENIWGPIETWKTLRTFHQKWACMWLQTAVLMILVLKLFEGRKFSNHVLVILTQILYISVSIVDINLKGVSVNLIMMIWLAKKWQII